MKEYIWHLNGWDFDPQKSYIKNKNSEIPLSNTLTNILLAFVESEGEVLSRDFIAEKGWSNRIVTDDSIRQSIKKLREIIDAESNESAIQTVRGKGYRLTIDCYQKEVIKEKSEEKKKSGLVKACSYFFGSLFVLSSFYFYFNDENKVQKLKVKKESRITYDNLGEFGFDISKNGDIAYGVLDHVTSMPSKLIIKDKNNNLIKLLEKSSAKGFLSQPVFSPSGNKLLFLDFGVDRCEISYFDLKTKQKNVIRKCSKADALIALDWINENEILYSTSKSLKFPLQINKYNLNKREYETISKLPIGGRGDFFASSCKEKIVTIRDINWSNHELHLIENGKSKKLKNVIGDPISFDWGKNCGEIYYNNKDGNVFNYDIYSMHSEKIIGLEMNPKSTIVFKNGSLYSSKDGALNTEIVSFNLNNKVQDKIYSSSGKIKKLKNFKDKKLFLSNRTGKVSLWKSDAFFDGEMEVFNLKGNESVSDYFYDHKADDYYISINNKIFKNSKGKNKELIYTAENKIRSFIIVNNIIYYVEYFNNGWQLVEYNKKENTKYITRDIVKIVLENEKIYVSDNEVGIYLYLGKSEIKLFANYQNGISKWTFDKDKIYFYDLNSIYDISTDNKLRKLADFKENLQVDINVYNSEVLIYRMTSGDTYIMKHELEKI